MKNEDFKFRVFVTLAKLHSFTKTAEALNVSQPAVSQNISELERYYGVNLVTRDRNGVCLTDDGLEFLPYARNILEAYSSAASFAIQHSEIQSASVFSDTIAGAKCSSGIDGSISMDSPIHPRRIIGEEASEENPSRGVEGTKKIDGKSVAKTLISGIVPSVRLLDSELADKLGEFIDSEACR